MIAATHTSRGDESPETVNAECRLDIDNFCEMALTRNRGVVRFAMVGSTDGLLALNLVVNRSLRKRMELSPEQVRPMIALIELHENLELSHDVAAQRYGLTAKEMKSGTVEELPPSLHIVREREEEWGTNSYIREKIQTRLAANLTEEQKNILDYLYLHSEGLMALVRPHLQVRLSLTKDDVARIEKIIDEHLTKKSIWRSLQMAIFSRPIAEKEHLPIRKFGAELDRKILAELSPQQLKKLCHIIKAAKPWSDYIADPDWDAISLQKFESAGSTVTK